MATKGSLYMDFMTDQNKKVRVTVPNPKQPIDAAAVAAAMDAVLSKGVFAFPQGTIVSKVGASYVETSTTSVN